MEKIGHLNFHKDEKCELRDCYVKFKKMLF